MNNLEIWNKVKAVPSTAIKPINGGRLKGMSDINPTWRLKVLTETFGVCGFGWKYEIISERLEHGCNDEISAFVRINLFVKIEGKWSEPIAGTGGSSFVAKEKAGLYQSDECFKMALTDAISVACKALGVGADVYWDKDKTKYNTNTPTHEQKTEINQQQIKRVYALAGECGLNDEAIKKWINGKFNKESIKELTQTEYDALSKALEKAKIQKGA